MEEAGPACRPPSLVKAAAPGHLVCHVDARQADIASALANYRRLGEATGADIVLEILLPGKRIAGERTRPRGRGGARRPA